MQNLNWSNRIRRWLNVAGVISVGTLAGAFIAGFGGSGRASRPPPAPPPAAQPPDAGPGGAPDAGVEAARTGQPRTGADIRRKKRTPARRVDRDHVERGQPLPRDYVE